MPQPYQIKKQYHMFILIKQKYITIVTAKFINHDQKTFLFTYPNS